MKQLVFPFMMLFAGCHSDTLHTMTGAFATCAKADLGKIMPSGLTLLGDVSAKIEGNSPTLEADLTALAALVTVDAIKCAIAAVEAVVTPGPAESGSGGTRLVVPPPGLVRAQAWAKAQK